MFSLTPRVSLHTTTFLAVMGSLGKREAQRIAKQVPFVCEIFHRKASAQKQFRSQFKDALRPLG